MINWGTYASNAVFSGNGNGLLNVMDHYDKVKEFLAIKSDAFITAASLRHFGMDIVMSKPTENNIPDAVSKGSNLEKRQWLHTEVSSMLDKYVMDNVSDLQDIHNDLPPPKAPRQEHPCRFPSCPKTCKYLKCLLRHEMKAHGLDLDSSSNSENDEKSPEESDRDDDEVEVDGFFDYGCLTLSLGLLLGDADDAVREGDGERLQSVEISIYPVQSCGQQ